MLKEKTKIEAIIGTKYDIKSQISVGGMGKIYLGIHRSLNKRVAIKIIHQEFRKDETFRKRFHREARLAANLDHPGIVDIYDFGSSDNFDYIIMPFIDGESLKEKLNREKILPLPESLNLIATITSALLCAHNNHVVHRDIKPSNILMDKQGHAYLTDFGISKDLEAVELTLPDTVIGSPRYISPEQITGKKIDGRCDLYALGLIFYEMVTGCYPYAGRSTNAVYYAQINEVPTRPDQINPDIPVTVSDIIMKLIEKLPDNRYQKGSEILQDIANAKSGLPLDQSSEPAPNFEAKPASISNGSIDDIGNDDTKTNGDQPTVINVSRRDKGQPFDKNQIAVDSVNSIEKPAAVRSSPLRLIICFVGILLCAIIGFMLLYNPSNQTESFITEKNGDLSSPEKNAPKDENHPKDRPSNIQRKNEEIKLGKPDSVPIKPTSASSETSLSEIRSKPNTQKVSLISLTEQLRTFKEGQDAKFIRLWTKEDVYKIGNPIEYYFQSNQDCHLIVILFSSSGEIIQIFPNRYHPDSQISAMDTYNIPSPDSDIELEVTGPPGIEELFAIVADEPISLFPFKAGNMPFFIVDETDPLLLNQIYENIQEAKKMNFKYKSARYAIAK